MAWSLVQRLPFIKRAFPKHRQQEGCAAEYSNVFYSCNSSSIIPSTQLSSSSTLGNYDRFTASASTFATTGSNHSTSFNHSTLHDNMMAGYSNFYLKLPDGRYMVRVRTADRKTIGSYIIEGHMI
ncbi:hypothetical protein O0I10_012735 [Lichtheimia ornata]|uniref:Uncharacterized protein n=1 Tax=Lichtheimia ornata TaxID=688661 RepID=A0AAD7UQH5_9FUNG|nr:uncharacterized protein O0I10_012735 [Lichtheimia ornata]KAJ8651702.1 hypothetical protein O0I10_012735 [Lichtheimia ornata]